jgi:hypothetical protein
MTLATGNIIEAATVGHHGVIGFSVALGAEVGLWLASEAAAQRSCSKSR